MRSVLTFIILLLLLASCEKELDPELKKAFGTEPVYSWVFPEEEIRSININVGAANWEKIQRDMEGRIGRKFGFQTLIPGVPIPQVNIFDIVPGDPIYIKADVTQGNYTWQKVGFRLKGNSSLSSSWRGGIYKLPFKLQFDEFEDQHREIKDQRFYGFRELNFSPSFSDNTFMKEKYLTTLFRKNKVLACKVAYYKVYIDFGQGSKYCGIYQVIEPVAEHLVKSQTGKQVGNIYKPESTLNNFTIASFEKQNNSALADYEDVKKFISVLNSTTKQTNYGQWKKELETIFDVKGFLRYLAVNNTVGNWDSYGLIAHNFFLINIDGKINFMPYDLNLSFQRGGSANFRTALSFEMKEVTGQWPLIRYLIDDPEYYAYYKAAVKDFINNDFKPALVSEYIQKHKAILQPHFEGPDVEKVPYSHLSNVLNFSKSISDLEKYVGERYLAASAF
jgi:spore coat protein H